MEVFKKQKLFKILLFIFIITVFCYFNSSKGEIKVLADETDFSNSCLTFSSSESFNLRISIGNNVHLEYYSSVDDNWKDVEYRVDIAAFLKDSSYVIYIRNKTDSPNTNSIGTFYFGNDNGSIECSGNIMTLIDYQEVLKGNTPSLYSYAFQSLFYNSTSLVKAPELPAQTLADYCYCNMFYGCTSLVDAPALPATTLASRCYESMFYGCTKLEVAPLLPATTLASRCYESMFYGCTSLVNAPELKATTLAESCCNSMFYGCTSLVNAPALPAQTLASRCYYSMFRGCTSLSIVSDLPATTLKDSCYLQMFYGCTSLVTAPKIEATKLAERCCVSMFYGCTSLVNAPELKAKTLAKECYQQMFYGCTSLVTAPKIEAEILAEGCCASMFSGCTSLVNAPELLAKTLAKECYQQMFLGCTSLVNAPKIEAEALAERCCESMFLGCTSLVSAPELLAKTLADSCYLQMFLGCTSLVIAPKIEAETLAESCCLSMFSGCIKLAEAPELKATTLADYCYNSMFSGCASLVKAPELNATKLAGCCYYLMFENCTSLTETCVLPATTLAISCYQKMFSGCTSLVNAPKIEAKTLAESCCNSMFSGCTKLINAPELPATALASHCYESMFSGCTSLVDAPELKAITLAESCYQQMFSGCTSLVNAPELLAEILKERCYQSMFSGCTSLVNAPELPATTLAAYCYQSMFSDCTKLISAPELSATTLAGYCYQSMFSGCTSLVNAPELPATTLINSCYQGMFSGCSSLINAPKLPATTLDNSCYQSMFSDCINLVTAPALPVIKLKNNCYQRMFSGCSSLINAPALPATTLTDSCYLGMFSGCTKLISAPQLPATTLAAYCYQSMFKGCTSLVNAPELPAQTLASNCYQQMFSGCTSLVTAPELPALTLTAYCYQGMFLGCTSLENVPELNATTLTDFCYWKMFYNCKNIRIYTNSSNAGDNYVSWSIPETVTKKYSLTEMFYGTSGDNVDTPNINTTYYVHVHTFDEDNICSCSSKKYQITYVLNYTNADNKTETTDYYIEGATKALKNIERSEYIFLGWTLTNEDSDTTYIKSIETSETGVKTYYAKWKKKTELQITVLKDTFTYLDPDIEISFKATGNNGEILKNFKIEYFVNGSYQEEAPNTVGTYKIRITRGEDYYYLKVENETLTLTIKPFIVTKPQEDNTKFVYNGLEQTYNVSTNPLYTISENTKKDANTYKVIISLVDKDNYIWENGDSSDLEYKFIISKATIDISQVKWDYETAFTYDGSIKEVKLVNLPTLVTATYTGNSGTNANNYIAKAILSYDSNNYELTNNNVKDLVWLINKAKSIIDISGVKTTYTYNEKEQVIKSGATLNHSEKELVYTNNKFTTVKEGNGLKVVISVEESSNYLASTAIVTINVNKALIDISQVKWDYETAFTYDGSIKEVKLVNLPTLVTATYTGNSGTNANNYIAKAILSYDSNNYELTNNNVKDLEWLIKKKKVAIPTAKTNLVYDGNTLVGVSDDTLYTVANGSGINANKYKAIVTLKDSLNYEWNDSSFNGEIEWLISKALIDMSQVKWDYETAFTYDGSIKEVKLVNLPSLVTATYTGNSGTNANNYIAKAVLSYDSNNYELSNTINDLSWKIGKTVIDMSQVKWDYETPFTYDGSIKEVKLVNLPSLVTATYTGNSGTNANNYIAKAILSYDSNNYELSNTINDLSWKIGKTVIDMSQVKWDYETPFTYDGSVKEVKLINLPSLVSAVYENNKKIAANNYVASVKLSYDNNNYELSNTIANLNWNISKAYIKDVNIARYVNVYDGKEHSAIISKTLTTVDGCSALWTFSLEENGYYIEEVPTFKDSGEYIVYYKIEAENHYVKNGTFKVKIAKAKVKVPTAISGLNYNGNVQVGIESSDYYEVTNNSGINAGEYKAILTLNDDTNYVWSDSSFNGEIVWKINKAKSIIDISGVKTTYTYNEKEQVIKSGATLNHSEKELVYTNNKFTTVKEGNGLKVVISVEESSNYLASTAIVTINVNKATYDMSNVSFIDSNLIYDGKAKSIEISGDLPEGVSVSYSGNNKKDVGKYEVIAKFSGDFSNYEIIPNISAFMTISNNKLFGIFDGKEVIVIEVINDTFTDANVSLSKISDISLTLQEKLKKSNKKVYEAYEVSIKENGKDVMLTENVNVKLLIPDELKNKDIQIYATIGDEVLDLNYTIENDYAIVSVSEVNEFYIVSAKNTGCSCNSAMISMLINTLCIAIILKKRRFI